MVEVEEDDGALSRQGPGGRRRVLVVGRGRGGGKSLKYWIECVDGLCRWWWVPMVGDSTIRFDVCRRDNDVARFDGWIPRDDDFGGFAMKILRGS